ncbi:MAG: menaquinone biosynthesis protein [Candidatus Eremiobacteraeota bacterium]|nr:menaquinone biosynthesis protein [Candidatus Eremiobacteraeota bacterium]
MSLRCGRIGYTNDLPIFAAFDAGAVQFPGTLHADVPTKLNAMLLSGELDFSPISAYAFAKNADQFVLLPDLCIGARGAVISVVLISRTPPELLGGATIAVTDESASAAGLLRVLLRRRFGVEASFRSTHSPLTAAHEGEPALLIGDTAIDAEFSFAREHIYDLGQLWSEWSGADSVFAVWAARKDVHAARLAEVEACWRALFEARGWGMGHLDRVAAAAQQIKPRSEGFYASYYRALNFYLDAGAERGLKAYWRELEAIGEIDCVPDFAPENFLVAG